MLTRTFIIFLFFFFCFVTEEDVTVNEVANYAIAIIMTIFSKHAYVNPSIR